MTDISTTTSENILTLGSNDEGSDLIAVSNMDENITEDERNQSGIVLVGDLLVIVVLFYSMVCLLILVAFVRRRRHVGKDNALYLDGSDIEGTTDEEETPTISTSFDSTSIINVDLEGDRKDSIEMISLIDKPFSIDSIAESHTKIVTAESITTVECEKPSRLGTLMSYFARFTPDSESVKLLNLTKSISARGAINPATNLLLSSIISSQIGDETVAAFLASKLIVDITSSFLCDCIVKAQYTYLSQAVGDKNFYLAGRLVHVTALLVGAITLLLLLPFWYFFMYDILCSYFGLDETVARIGLGYTYLYGITSFIITVQQTYETLLDVDNHEDFNAFMYVVRSVTFLLVTGSLLLVVDQVELYMLGALELFCAVFCFIIHILYPFRKQWVSSYREGIVACWTRDDLAMTRKLLSDGFTVSIGTTVAHFEWQMVSIFVAEFDPNEVAAFFLIGTIWDFFYSITSGITGAAQIRVAQNLGECNIEKAKESAFRSIGIVGFLTGTGAVIGLCLRHFISTSFASDEATISVINDTLPIILFGTFVDGFGNVASGIVEGQGRFQLTSSVAVAQTLFLAVPLSALMTYALDFGVQGIASALVMAYLTSGTFILIQVFSSNWELYTGECQKQEEILTECELQEEETTSMYGNDGRGSECMEKGVESGGINGICKRSLVPSVIPMVCPSQEGTESFSSASEEFIA